MFRHLLGEDLGPLSVKELQQLEQQIESTLTQAMRRRVNCFLQSSKQNKCLILKCQSLSYYFS